MQGISPFPQSGPEARENWRVVNDVADELYFLQVFQPGSLTPVGGSGPGAVGGGRVGSLILPDAATTNGRFVIRVPNYAARHYLRIRYRATSNTTGNSFLIRFAAWAYGESSNYNTGSTLLGDTTLTVAGPVAAMDRLAGEVLLSSAIIGPGFEEIAGFIERNGVGDTNNGAFHLVRLDLELVTAP